MAGAGVEAAAVTMVVAVAAEVAVEEAVRAVATRMVATNTMTNQVITIQGATITIGAGAAGVAVGILTTIITMVRLFEVAMAHPMTGSLLRYPRILCCS